MGYSVLFQDAEYLKVGSHRGLALQVDQGGLKSANSPFQADYMKEKVPAPNF